MTDMFATPDDEYDDGDDDDEDDYDDNGLLALESWEGVYIAKHEITQVTTLITHLGPHLLSFAYHKG